MTDLTERLDALDREWADLSYDSAPEAQGPLVAALADARAETAAIARHAIAERERAKESRDKNLHIIFERNTTLERLRQKARAVLALRMNMNTGAAWDELLAELEPNHDE